MDREDLFNQNWSQYSQKWSLDLTNLYQQQVVKVSLKADQTLLTNIDTSFLSYFESALKSYNAPLLSEENSFRLMKYPLFILDPVDGTRELTQGKDEWSVSLAYCSSNQLNDPNNQAYIFWLKSNKIYTHPRLGPVKGLGMVSRTEWEQKYYEDFPSEKFLIEPCGSIALKLARLSDSEIDFVLSLKPKHVWDIAAGSILNARHGFSFYSNGKKITSLDFLLYEPPLFWGPEELYQKLLPWINLASQKDRHH